MARHSKVEAAAINLRIPSTSERNYQRLIEKLVALKRGVKVYGESFVAISYYDPSENIGLFSKYMEIDINGEWFDIDDFDTATPEKIEEINIPGSLRPNHARFYFSLDASLHVVAFETYSESRGLSAASVEKYFRSAFTWDEIKSEFGRVEADLIKDYADVAGLLSEPQLRELRLTVRRPNTDDVGDDLASVIEERLRRQNADEYEEALKAKGGADLQPDERTKKLATLAAENGQVRTRRIVNGVMVSQDSSKSPLIEVATYASDESEMNIFRRVAKKIFGRVEKAREEIRG